MLKNEFSFLSRKRNTGLKVFIILGDDNSRKIFSGLGCILLANTLLATFISHTSAHVYVTYITLIEKSRLKSNVNWEKTVWRQIIVMIKRGNAV